MSGDGTRAAAETRPRLPYTCIVQQEGSGRYYLAVSGPVGHSIRVVIEARRPPLPITTRPDAPPRPARPSPPRPTSLVASPFLSLPARLLSILPPVCPARHLSFHPQRPQRAPWCPTHLCLLGKPAPHPASSPGSSPGPAPSTVPLLLHPASPHAETLVRHHPRPAMVSRRPTGRNGK